MMHWRTRILLADVIRDWLFLIFRWWISWSIFRRYITWITCLSISEYTWIVHQPLSWWRLFQIVLWCWPLNFFIFIIRIRRFLLIILRRNVKLFYRFCLGYLLSTYTLIDTSSNLFILLLSFNLFLLFEILLFIWINLFYSFVNQSSILFKA